MTTATGGVRGHWMVLLLAVLFLGPPLVATIMYLHPDIWQPGATTNHGELIYPPMVVDAAAMRNLEGEPFAPEDFRGHWTIGYVSDGDCLGLCQERLFHMRQVRVALGKDRERVERLLLTTAAGRDNANVADVLQMYPGLAAATRPESDGIPVAGSRNGAMPREGEMFIVDPQGNLMMRYPEDAGPMDLLEDLRKLLRASRFG